MIYWFAALTANAATATLMVPIPPTAPPPPIIQVPSLQLQAPKKGVESPAIPKNYPGLWANTNDYPSKALQEEREGTTAFSVKVSKDGTVTNCTVTESSGHADLDEATCSNVSKRATFYPAQGKKGRPIEGSYANRVRWQIPSIATTASMPIEDDSYPRSPQLRTPFALRVAKEDYPATAKAALQQGMVVFSLDIDNGGTVRGCSITKSTTFPDLDNQSCALAQKWQFDPARNLAGDPVAGRTTHYINWRLPKGTVGAAGGMSGPRTNPFENSGEMAMTLDFDKDGKLKDCVMEHKGELPIFGFPPGLSENMCKNGMRRADIKPFLDANGKPQARRVILKISVDHADAPSETPKED